MRPPSRSLRAVLSWALALLLLIPANVAADPLARVTLRLVAPPGCPSLSVLQAELKHDLEGSQVPARRLEVHATIERLSADSWRAQVHCARDDGTSDRTLLARSCGALVEATSLIVAMIIDPETAATHARSIEGVTSPTADRVKALASDDSIVAASATTPEVSASAPPTPPIAPPPVAAPPPTKTSSTLTGPRGLVSVAAAQRSQELALLFAAWAGVDHGSLPSITLAFGGALGIVRGPWRSEAALGWWLPRSTAAGVAPNPAAGGKFGLIAGNLKLCRDVLELGQLRLGPCLGLELGRWSGDGNDALLTHQTQHRVAASGLASALGTYELTRVVALRLDLGAWVPLRRPEFGYTDLDSGQQNRLFRPVALVARGQFGLELRFR